MQGSGFPLERTRSRERFNRTMLGRLSNAVGCKSKRLFSVLSHMYQSYMYIKCETIQRFVLGKTSKELVPVVLQKTVNLRV